MKPLVKVNRTLRNSVWKWQCWCSFISLDCLLIPPRPFTCIVSEKSMPAAIYPHIEGSIQNWSKGMYKYEALTAVLQWSGKMVNKYVEREKAPNKLYEPVPLFPTFLLLYITCNIMHLHVHVHLCSKKISRKLRNLRPKDKENRHGQEHDRV
jgi:hypothetical protein